MILGRRIKRYCFVVYTSKSRAVQNPVLVNHMQMVLDGNGEMERYLIVILTAWMLVDAGARHTSSSIFFVYKSKGVKHKLLMMKMFSCSLSHLG